MLLTMKQDDSPYYADLRDLNLSPGWARPEPSMWPSPQPKFKPAVWRFADAKQALDASHNMVPADQTERRNLIMVNPIEGNTYATTRHLVAAYQCVMPGDSARTHRHSAAALRLVLHGKARRLHHRERHAHRHAAGRGAADAGVVLARPRQRYVGDRLLDRLPRHSVHPAHRGDVLRAVSAGRPRGHHRHRPDADAHPLDAKRSAPAAMPRRSRSPRASCRRSRSI